MTVAELIKSLQEANNMDALVDLDVAAIPTPTGTAATDLWSSTAHGLEAGDAVEILALTGGTGIAVGTFYVRTTGLTANAFELSASAPDADGEGAIAGYTTDVTAATIVRRTMRAPAAAADVPSPVGLPADAPDAAATAPGRVVLA